MTTGAQKYTIWLPLRLVSGQFCFSSTINTGGICDSVNSNIYVLLQQGHQ